MRQYDVFSKLGAERLADDNPKRDEKRGGNGLGMVFKRTIPAPEKASEVTAACEAFNKLAQEKGWTARIDPVKLYLKAASLLCQAEMNALAFEKLGKKEGKTPTGPKPSVDCPEI